MAFDHCPIGIGDGLSEPRWSCLDRSLVSGCPSLENALGTVDMVLVPSDRNHFDSPACIATGGLSMVGIICPRNQGRYSIFYPRNQERYMKAMNDDCMSTGDLTVRISDIERRLGKRNKRWISTPSNVISLLAVLVTVFIFIVTFILGQREDKARKLQEVGQLIDQISTLAGEEIELYNSSMPQLLRANALISISNRRNVLIDQVDSLLPDIKDNMSKMALAMLAISYASAGLFEKAEEYLLNLANAEHERQALRVMAWRSLVGIYGQWGTGRISDAENAAKRGMELINKKTQDPILRNELVSIPYTLASAQLFSKQYDDAFRSLLEAEQNAWKLPCGGARLGFLRLLEPAISQVLTLYPDGRDHIAKVRNNRKANVNPCEGVQMAVSTAAKQSYDNYTLNRSTEDEFAGTYKLGANSISIKSDTNKTYRATGLPGPSRTLVFVSRDLFALYGVPVFYISFQRDVTGHVTHMLLMQPNGSFELRRE